MKTLNEQINEVMNARVNNNCKREQLVKLGLRPFDIEMIFDLQIKSKKTGKKFDAFKLTFGVEIECYNVNSNSLVTSVSRKNVRIQSERYNHIDNKEYFKLVSDGSIVGNNPIECVSPILKGKQGENALKSVCDSLNEIGAKVNRSTGLHVHIGASTLTEAHICRIVRNYAKLETAIDVIMPQSRRGSNNMYCRSLIGRDLSVNTINAMRSELCHDRYHKINLEAFGRHKTIEFRQHSGTTDYTKISMWLLFIRELVNYSYDNEITNYTGKLSECEFLSEKFRNYAKLREDYFIERESL